ncbi:conserved hypothetical protein [Beggiatoa sp. PS]|nr:conserved hypothetical protein [Beggiatoa sp. PS]
MNDIVSHHLTLEEFDIAVLKVILEHRTSHCVPLGLVSNQDISDEIVALGYPAGHRSDNQQIGTYQGRISKFRDDHKIENDAMKGRGQSGGPVYHYKTHRIIGLASAGYKPEIMLNVGLAVRFEKLFETWAELSKLNQDVVKIWKKRLKQIIADIKSEKLMSSEQPIIAEIPSKKTKSPPASLSPIQIEPCGGAMLLDSKFYVERHVDATFQTAIQRRDSIVLLKGPRQVGKTSLLAKGLQQAREAGVLVLLTDFQKLIDAQLQNLETFFMAIGEMLADQLELDVYPEDKWRPNRAPNMNFDNYFRREILRKTDKQLLWAIDEADRLFLCNFSSEVFALFRTWHNERALNPSSPCSKLTLAIAYATETYLFIKDQNQSPFNVGTKLMLEDFTLEHLADLNRRYGMPFKTHKEIKQFHQLVGGQPYLVRCGLNDIVSHHLTLEEFISKADHDDGTYGDHLRRIVRLIHDDEQLSQAMRHVLRDQVCPDYDSFCRLRSAGILRGDSKDNVSLRCEIYRRYLKKLML